MDTDNFKDESQIWGKEFEFLYWEATTPDGQTYKIAENTAFTAGDNYSVTLTDVDGNSVILPSGTTLKAKYREFSDVVLFFVNYNGTVLDTVGDVTGRNTAEFTHSVAIGHVYYGTQTVGSDTEYAQAANAAITGMFRPTYDPDDTGTQIVIDALLTVDKDTAALEAFEVDPGATSDMVAEHLVNYLREKQILIYLSSANDPQPSVSYENMTLANYNVRWYVLKEQYDGWHIDGVMVAETQQLAVTKGFHGLNAEQISGLMTYSYDESEKTYNNFNILASLVKSTGTEPYFTLATSNDSPDAAYDLFVYNGNTGNSSNVFSWTVNTLIGEPYQFTEQNYGLDGYDCAKVVTIHYADGTVNQVFSNSDSTPADANIMGGTVDSVDFDNYYTETGTGMLYISKKAISTNGLGELLSGANFTLSMTGTDGNDYSATAVSDDNGIVFFSGLTTGTYTLQEVEAPEGFILNNTVWTVEVGQDTDNITVSTVDADGDVTQIYSTSDGLTSALVIENEPKNDTLTVVKQFQGITKAQVDALTEYAINITGTDFSRTLLLTAPDGGTTDTEILPQISADGLTYTWHVAGVKEGDYTFAESGYHSDDYADVVVTAAGYEGGTVVTNPVIAKNGDDWTATFTGTFADDRTDSVTVTNRYINTFTLSLTKTNADGSERLTGAEFKVYGPYADTEDQSDWVWVDTDGNGIKDKQLYYIGTAATGGDGTLTFSGTAAHPLRLGETYALVETVTPIGYVPDDTPILVGPVTPDSEGYSSGVYSVTVTNENTYKLTVYKTWVGEPKDSVTVRVYRTANGITAEYGSAVLTAEGNWTHTWEDVPYADDSGNVYTYHAAEDAVDGYQTDYDTDVEALTLNGVALSAAAFPADITEDGVSVTVTNTQAYVLPSTGGVGTTPWTVSGLLLMAAAALAYITGRIRRGGKGHRRSSA